MAMNGCSAATTRTTLRFGKPRSVDGERVDLSFRSRMARSRRPAPWRTWSPTRSISTRPWATQVPPSSAPTVAPPWCCAAAGGAQSARPGATLPYLESLAAKWIAQGAQRDSSTWTEARELSDHVVDTWPEGGWYRVSDGDKGRGDGRQRGRTSAMGTGTSSRCADNPQRPAADRSRGYLLLTVHAFTAVPSRARVISSRCRKGVNDTYSGFLESRTVTCDDDQVVDKSSDRNQAVFNWHDPARAAKLCEQLFPRLSASIGRFLKLIEYAINARQWRNTVSCCDHQCEWPMQHHRSPIAPPHWARESEGSVRYSAGR